MISLLIIRAIIKVCYFLRLLELFFGFFIKLADKNFVIEHITEKTKNGSNLQINVDTISKPSHENSSADVPTANSAVLFKNQTCDMKNHDSFIKPKTRYNDIFLSKEAFMTVEKIMISLTDQDRSDCSNLEEVETAFQALIDSCLMIELCDYSPTSGLLFSSICNYIRVYIEHIHSCYDVSNIDLSAAKICSCINLIEKLLHLPIVTESRFHRFCIDQLNLLIDRCLELGEEFQEIHCFYVRAEKCILMIEKGIDLLNDARGQDKCWSTIRHVENDIIQFVSSELNTMQALDVKIIDPMLSSINGELEQLKNDSNMMTIQKIKSKRSSKSKNTGYSGLERHSKRSSFVNKVKKAILFRRS